jgi:hypothetical protein
LIRKRVKEISGALGADSRVEHRVARQVRQVVGKVRQFVQKEVGLESMNSGGKACAVEDVADDGFGTDGCQNIGLSGRPRHGADGMSGRDEQR